MAHSYSYDFRKKVMDFVLKGGTCTAAAAKFDIGVTTVRRWYKRYQQEGHYRVKFPPGKPAQVERSVFEAYVRENPDLTLAQIGHHFGIKGPSVFYYMKKFGFSYKKKSPAMWRQTTKNAKNI